MTLVPEDRIDPDKSTNCVDSDTKESDIKKTTEKEMDLDPSTSAHSQSDSLVSWQKRITFPNHENEEVSSIIVGTPKDDFNPPPSKDTSERAPKPKADPTLEETRVMLPDPVIVRRYDFSPRAVQDFLLDYPDHRENLASTRNVRFFNNEFAFKPGGVSIDDFHVVVKGRFRVLEDHHG
jgi:hypothetical protein